MYFCDRCRKPKVTSEKKIFTDHDTNEVFDNVN